jgi:hypothetical protein
MSVAAALRFVAFRPPRHSGHFHPKASQGLREDGKEYDQAQTVTVRSGAQVAFAFSANRKEQLPMPVEQKR